MKSLTQYIYEALTAPEAILQSIKTDSLTREQRIAILIKNDKKLIQNVSDILKQKHKDDYFPYEPQKDDYIKDIDKVCGQIVDAVINLEK